MSAVFVKSSALKRSSLSGIGAWIRKKLLHVLLRRSYSNSSTMSCSAVDKVLRITSSFWQVTIQNWIIMDSRPQSPPFQLLPNKLEGEKNMWKGRKKEIAGRWTRTQYTSKWIQNGCPKLYYHLDVGLILKMTII